MKKTFILMCAASLLISVVGGPAAFADEGEAKDEIGNLNRIPGREALLEQSGAGGPAPLNHVSPGDLSALSLPSGSVLHALAADDVKQWCGVCHTYLGVADESTHLPCPNCEGTPDTSPGGSMDVIDPAMMAVLLGLAALILIALWAA